MKTMTVRNIPDEVAQWLAQQADERRASINTTTLAVLSAAALPNKRRCKRDVSSLFGSWSEAEGRRFDRVVADAFEKVNAQDWEPQK